MAETEERAGQSRWKKVRIPTVGGPFASWRKVSGNSTKTVKVPGYLVMYEARAEGTPSAVLDRVPMLSSGGTYLLRYVDGVRKYVWEPTR